MLATRPPVRYSSFAPRVDQNRSSTGYNGVDPADGECHVSNTSYVSRVSYVLWRGSGGQPLQWHRFRPTTPGFIAALTANRVKSPWEHEDTTHVMTQVRERPLISHSSFCVFYLYPSDFVTEVVFYFIIRSFFSRFLTRRCDHVRSVCKRSDLSDQR